MIDSENETQKMQITREYDLAHPSEPNSEVEVATNPELRLAGSEKDHRAWWFCLVGALLVGALVAAVFYYAPNRDASSAMDAVTQPLTTAAQTYGRSGSPQSSGVTGLNPQSGDQSVVTQPTAQPTGPCNSSLSVTPGAGQGAMGTLSTIFTIVNSGVVACTIQGYPVIDIYGPQPGCGCGTGAVGGQNQTVDADLDVQINHDSYLGNGDRIDLLPGQSAKFVLSYPDPGMASTTTTCQQAAGIGFETPLGMSSMLVPMLFTICGPSANESAIVSAATPV